MVPSKGNDPLTLSDEIYFSLVFVTALMVTLGPLQIYTGLTITGGLGNKNQAKIYTFDASMIIHCRT